MNYNEFVLKYSGKATDYDGVSGVQCVDLIKSYLNDVFDIKAGAWADARHYYENFNCHKELVNNFNKIPNTPSLVPQKGDICVWNKNISNSHDCGHIAIATGEGDIHSFYSYDQNWNGKAMKKVKHSYRHFYGVLRPKNQNKVGGICMSDVIGDISVWKNGSTKETVYADTSKKLVIGSLDKYEKCSCAGKVNGMYLVIYTLNSSNAKKCGFVSYHGGVK